MIIAFPMNVLLMMTMRNMIMKIMIKIMSMKALMLLENGQLWQNHVFVSIQLD